MCGRYTLYKVEDLDRRYNLSAKPGFVSRDNYNVAPRQRVPVIYQKGDKRIAELMQWGFLPSFAKNPTASRRPINTVSETAFEKPMWANAMKHCRCLVPARGFYEWKELPDKRKQPYYIHPKGRDIFSFAGIYSIWLDVEGKPFPTFSILTTAPNEQMGEIHNRMPVILTPEQETFWLEPAYSEPGQLAGLLVPYEGELEMYGVSEDVNNPRNNDTHLIDPEN